MGKFTRAVVAGALAAPLVLGSAGIAAASSVSGYGVSATQAGAHGAGTFKLGSVAANRGLDSHHRGGSLSAWEKGGTWAGPGGALTWKTGSVAAQRSLRNNDHGRGGSLSAWGTGATMAGAMGAGTFGSGAAAAQR